MHRFVEVEPGVRLWTEQVGDPGAEPLLLIMGANASGLTWPDSLISLLARRHRVIRYDHRDTGRSTWAFDDDPYAIADLADDAVAVLDAWDVDRAHVVGMSMGGTLVQLLLLDNPDRLLTATLLCSSALPVDPEGPTGPTDSGSAPDLPGPDPALLRMWQELEDPRDREAELRWRVEHWRLLNGTGTSFDAAGFRAMEERILDHADRPDSPAAHASADDCGLDRGGELAAVTVPTLVIEAPEDPVNPPPHSGHLSRAIGTGRLVRIQGMGHALNATVIEPVAAAILSHTTLDPAPVPHP